MQYVHGTRRWLVACGKRLDQLQRLVLVATDDSETTLVNMKLQGDDRLPRDHNREDFSHPTASPNANIDCQYPLNMKVPTALSANDDRQSNARYLMEPS
jgi:hypothetical protein